MKRKYSYDDVKEFIESKGCKLLSDEYKDNKTILKIQCKCGSIINRCFQEFKNKERYYCQECTGNKVGYKKVKDKIESYGGELLSKEYKNRFTPLLVKCRKCGEVYETTWELFGKSKTKTCKKCAEKIRQERNKNNPNGHYYSLSEIKSLCESTNESILLSTKYDSCENLKLKCKCGEIYEQNFYHIKGKLKNNLPILCPKCMKKTVDNSFRNTENEINEFIFNKYGYQKFIIIDYENYTNEHEKNKYQCTKCGHTFTSNLNNLIYSERLCPECETEYSKGVYSIIHYLSDKNINFEMEKKFDNCKYERPLPFDFYLPDYNCCIEYDGEQHIRATTLYGGEEGLKKVKLRDSIKNKYCKDNNIPLLRISHKENENINMIIDNFIDKLIPR